MKRNYYATVAAMAVNLACVSYATMSLAFEVDLFDDSSAEFEDVGSIVWDDGSGEDGSSIPGSACRSWDRASKEKPCVLEGKNANLKGELKEEGGVTICILMGWCNDPSGWMERAVSFGGSLSRISQRTVRTEEQCNEFVKEACDRINIIYTPPHDRKDPDRDRVPGGGKTSKLKGKKR